MADKKITQLNNITGANLADADEFVVVDISADETMAVTRAELFLSVPAITVDGDVTFGANANFGDNGRATFGASSDLQIFHNGSNSYVQDNGTGILIVQGSTGVHIQGRDATDMIRANEGNSVELYFNDVRKLVTSSTGVNITGTVTSDSLTLANGGTQTITGPLNQSLFINSQGNASGEGTHIQGNAKTRIFIEDTTGDISFYEDTGVTPKLRWKAGTERLGIGTVSPTEALDVAGTVKATSYEGSAITISAGSPTVNVNEIDANNGAGVAHRLTAAGGQLYIQARATNGTNAGGTINVTGMNSTDLGLFRVKAGSSTFTGSVEAVSYTGDGSQLTGIEGTQTGVVNHFAASSAPTGYLKANGATVSRSTYAALFAVVGEVYGAGDGSTTFEVPDLRGEFIRGWDDSRGIDASRVFGSNQSWAIENILGAFGLIRVQLNNNWTDSGAVEGTAGASSGDSNAGAANTANFTFDASRVVQTSTETRPRNVALLACIKF